MSLVAQLAPLLSLLTAASVVIVVYAALRLFHASRIVGDQALILEGISLLMYAVALVLEVSGLVSVALGGRWWWHSGEAHALGEGVYGHTEAMRIVQASLLAGYMYVASYAVHAGSLYASTRGREPGQLLAATIPPFLSILYTDYNILALLLLAAICFALVELYRATLQAIVYHLLLAASHILGIAAPALGATWLLAPVLLRSLAPLTLLPPLWRRGRKT